MQGRCKGDGGGRGCAGGGFYVDSRGIKREDMGKLYLLPNVLGEGPLEGVLPAAVMERMQMLRVFATENERNTRRLLRRLDRERDLDEVTFLEVSEHSGQGELEAVLPYLEREDVGVVSEAGCPGVADPGAELVALAHGRGVEVVPMVGPSSILLALMASGASGQRFSFNGYLPVRREERARELKRYERRSAEEDRAEIFIEAPYRNEALLEEMTRVLAPGTRLTIARDLTTPLEWARTRTVAEWRGALPEVQRHPTVFVVYAGRGFRKNVVYSREFNK